MQKEHKTALTKTRHFHEDMKVLVVDDDTFSREIIKDHLSEIGLGSIEEAANGIEAAKRLKSDGNQVELILCDWKMPKMDGIELLKFVRKDETLSDLPFIMVTSVGDVENIKEAILAGVSDYIAKPVDIDTLKTKITSDSLFKKQLQG